MRLYKTQYEWSIDREQDLELGNKAEHEVIV